MTYNLYYRADNLFIKSTILHLDQEKFVVIIAGPTAIGKTRLSIEVAKRLDAEIFSADSRQIYHEMTIGTAKPTPEEMAEVKHHFIGHRSIHQGYSVGDYQREMMEVLPTYFENHNVAILTGGSGMYIHALTDGLNTYPDVSPEVIESLEMTLKVGGLEMLQRELQESDPEYYDKVDINNPMRVIRALSVIHESGETFSSFQQAEKETLPYTFVPILLERDREELYDRINDRVDIMMKSGLLKEAKSLHQYQDLKSLNTVGYQELFRYIDGEIDIVTAVELIQRNSRRYAKRQLTWFRKHANWNTFHPDEIEKIITYIYTQVK